MAKKSIGTDETRDIDWVAMNMQMEKARNLVPGKQYTLYVYNNADKTRAVRIKRKLEKHYKNFALFSAKGVHTTTYKYTELAQMLQTPPEGCMVISEKQARDAEW